MGSIIAINHDGTERELDMSTMKMRESMECQSLTGWTWPEWRSHLIEDRAEAVTFAWFLACKRHGDDVTFSGLLDTLDQAKISFEVKESDDGPADKPAELGAEEGPTLPAETVGETQPNDPK